MNEQVRVLRVVGRMDRGGAETTIMNAYRLIDRSKLQFDFVVHTEDDCVYNKEITDLGGRIFCMPRYDGLNHFKYIREWEYFFKNNQEYNLIHGHLMTTAAIYLKIAKKHGLTTIAHSHAISLGNDFLAIPKRLLQHNVEQYADHLFACSTMAGKWFFGPDVTSKSNFKVIPNGIDVNKYTYNTIARQGIKNALGINDSFVIGHVGSFSWWKNHQFLISVFKKINDIRPDTLLLLVGSGKLRKQIEQKIEGYGLNDKIILTGTRSDVNRLLQAMDVFVFPSLSEGFGNAVTEAQAAGLPCIVSDIVPQEVGITDLVEFVPLKCDVNIWAEKIIEKLKSTERRNTSEEISRAGYDIKPIAKWYENFYLENSLPRKA